MKGNTDKCNLIMSSNDSIKIQIGNLYIKRWNYEKIQGDKTKTQLTFHGHAKDLCRKINSQVGALYFIYGSCKKQITNEFLFCSTVQLLSSNMDVPQSK